VIRTNSNVSDILIIGAGVIGCSIAFHLARLGCWDIVVLEKDDIGSGSTGKCAGGIRQQFSTEANIRLSMESVRFFEHFEEETGYPADFRQYGYLMLATTEEEVEAFKKNVALQKGLGINVSLLTRQEVKELVPSLNTDDVLAASYCPSDGYADPHSVVQGFARAAREMGVKFRRETEVTAIERKGRVWQVRTSQGNFHCSILVIAAGAYSGLVGKMLGLDIPLHPHRRHLFITSPCDEIPKNSPLVVEFRTGFWFRREGRCLIFGMRNPDEPEGFDTTVDWGFLPAIGVVAHNRLPLLNELSITSAQAGLHDDTPDSNAIIGAVPGLENLYLACGFSGHGFMHSPAVGRVVADIIAGKNAPDIACFALERFKTGTGKGEACFI